MELALNASAAATVGSQYTATLGGQALTDATTAAIPCTVEHGTITLMSGPDLVVTNIETAQSTLAPGSTLSLSWNVKNQGGLSTFADATWREEVALVSAHRTVVLKTFSQTNEGLAPDATLSRSVTGLEIPQAPGLEGDVKIQVRILNTSSAGEGNDTQNNNTSLSTSSITLSKQLYLDLPPEAVAEARTTPLRCTLTRSGNWLKEETFTLTHTEDARVDLPASVTIPSGQSAAYFYLTMKKNGLLDTSQDVQVTFASDNGYEPVSGLIHIQDDVLPTLELTASNVALKEGDTFTLTVTTQHAPKTDVRLMLTCDHPKRFQYPAGLTLTAGSTTATAEVKAIDDTTPDLDIAPVFTVSSTNYIPGELAVILTDNDVPEIDLILSQNEVNESAGPTAVLAKLIRTGVTNNRITVKLSDNLDGRLYFSRQSFTMEAGVTEIQFSFGPADNSQVDGTKVGQVTAAVYISSCSCSPEGTQAGTVTQALTVYDDDDKALRLVASPATWQEGKTTGRITLIHNNEDTSTPVNITLTSDYDNFLEYPSAITIPAGASRVEVPVVSKENAGSNDNRTVLFTATAEGYTKAIGWVMITDQTLPDALIDEIELSQTEVEVEGKTTLNLNVRNDGFMPLPAFTKVNIYRDGSPEVFATHYTQEEVPVGGSTTLSKEIDVPATPGSYTFHAIINENRAVSEQLYVNNTSARITLKVLPAFTATATTGKAVYLRGEPVVISGKATGRKAANASIDVYLINEGVREVQKTMTDSEGYYSLTWQPYALQCGHIAIGACYPGEGQSTEMTAIDIYGFRRTSNSQIRCEMTSGTPFEGGISLYNPGKLALTNVTAELKEPVEGCDVFFTPLSKLEGGKTETLRFTLTTNEPSTGGKWIPINLTLHTEQGVSLDATIYYYCHAARAKLETGVPRIQTTMIKGQSRAYSFDVTNVGKGATGIMTLDLTAAVAGWMQAVTPLEMPSLEYAESATIILRLTPTEEMQINNPITGSLAINCENVDGVALKFTIEPVSEATGTLVVDVCDEFTYHSDEAPHVKGATVYVKHPTTGQIVAQGTTDENGLFRTTLNEGWYTIGVTEPNHSSYSNYILVDPGKITNLRVDISYSAISVDWKVVETEVEDVYDIKTTVTYETNVPKPVVEFVAPDSIAANLLQPGESLLFYVTCTNKGLITAQNLTYSVSAPGNFYRFEPLIELPIDLGPQESVAIPFFATRIGSGNTETEDPDIDIVPDEPATPVKRRSGSGAPCAGEGTGEYGWPCGGSTMSASQSNGIGLGGNCDGEEILIDAGNTTSVSIKNDGDEQVVEYEKGKGPSLGGGGDITIPLQTIDGCNPCTVNIPSAITHCAIGFIPFFGSLDGSVTCILDIAGAAFWEKPPLNAVISCAFAAAGWVAEIKDLTPLGLALSAASCALSFSCLLDEDEEIRGERNLIQEQLPCGYLGDWPKEHYMASYQGADGKSYAYVKWSLYMQQKYWFYKNLEDCISHYNAMLRCIFGQKDFMNSSYRELCALVNALAELPGSEQAQYELLLPYKPDNISTEVFQTFIDRWNNTVLMEANLPYDESNYINTSTFMAHLTRLDEHLKEMPLRTGHSDIVTAMQHHQDEWSSEANENNKGAVCATIQLQLSQTMTMTRQAFRGTLTVGNGSQDLPMENMVLNLKVTDPNGKVATAHEFQINVEDLKNVKGEKELGSGWSIAPGETGTVTILFIPTKYAAPEEEVVYSFGGSLSYTNPHTGAPLTRALYPVELTVKPSPNLNLTYFMQRNVKGDDALTKDVVEPSEPAEFALLIHNVGEGEAQNVRLTTGQPQIIENEKGAFINFELLSAQLNGGEKTMALGSSVATDFGTITAGGTGYAQWWLKFNLMGHFADYDVQATHVTSYGNEDLSLLNEVTIHELIRSIRANTADNEEVIAWLVDDIEDRNDYPDMLYLANGTTESVSNNAVLGCTRLTDTEYLLTVTPQVSGWNYGTILDPTQGQQKLIGITRQSDGKELSLQNFWQTDCTIRDESAPTYEKRLHMADVVTGETQYLLTFEPKPEKVLAVENFSGQPESGVICETPVTELTVKFNKDIRPETFTTDDLTLNCQGEYLDKTKIGITPITASQYALDISELTKRDGYYILTVQTATITDAEGYEGEAGKKADWVQYKPITVPGTIKAGSFATRIFPFPPALPLGVKAYSCYGLKNESTISLIAADKPEANTPYILWNYTEEDIDITLTGYNEAIEDTYKDGWLVGVYSANHLFPARSYVLQTQDGVQAFHEVKKALYYTATPYRSYLLIDKENGNSEVRSYGMSFDDQLVDISQVTNSKGAQVEAIYNVRGEQVPELQRGLNLVKMSNGQTLKVIVR